MNLTADTIDDVRIFHVTEECRITTGPRGARHIHMEQWRRSGRTQRWKRSPLRFKVPVKFGMGRTAWQNGYITQDNVHLFHASRDCPIYAELARDSLPTASPF